MKIAFLLGLTLSSLCTTEALSTSWLTETDSLPVKQSDGFTQVRFQPAPSRVAFQPAISLPGFSQSVRRVGQPQTGDIALIMAPLVDARSVAVRIGHQWLEAGKDYVYLPNENRVRILNQQLLASDGTLEITYKAQRFTYQPRFAILPESK